MWAFNHELDYIQAVMCPSAYSQGSSLILHGMQDTWPNARFPAKLLWEVMGDDGLLLQVSKIHVIFKVSGIAGFIFEYGTGRVQHSAGCTSGESHIMALEDGEIPSRMDVLTRGAGHAVIVSEASFFHPHS